MSAHPRFPEWAQHPEPRMMSAADDSADDLLCMIEAEADRAYAFTRRDPRDYAHPEGRANLRRYLLAMQAANREIGA